MEGPEHLCNPDVVEKASNDRLKKLLLGKHRQTDPYRCGGCTATFTTICCLHLHCLKHNGGGAYYFDSLTSTAFPKYETTCVYTQVTFQDIMSDIVDQEREMSTKMNAENTKPVRLSKRIAMRKTSKSATHKKKKRTKLKNEQIDTIENDTVTDDKVTEIKEDGTEVFLSDIKSETLSKSLNDSCQNTHIYGSSLEKEDSQIKELCEHPSEEKNIIDQNNAETGADLSEEDSMETNEISDTCRIKNEHFKAVGTQKTLELEKKSEMNESDFHEKDELTASEVLLAISKGDNSEISRNDSEQQNTSFSTVGTVDEQMSSCDSKQDKTEHKGGMESLTGSKQGGCELQENEKIVECKTCGIKGTKTMQRYHRYIHMDENRLTCDVCGLKFKTPRSLTVSL